MEKYKESIKKRIKFEVAGVIILIPVGIFVLIKILMLGSPINGGNVTRFLGGVISGVKAASILGYNILILSKLIGDIKSLKNKEKLIEQMNVEKDEREMAIREKSGKTSIRLFTYLLAISTIVTTPYLRDVSLTLFFVFMVLVICRVSSWVYYERTM